MKKVIKKYLLNYAKENNWDKFDENKLDTCIDYIKSQARKRAEDGVAVIEDKEVFGWAVHYFDEDGNVEIDNNFKATAKVAVKKEEDKPKKEKPVVKKKAEKDDGQMSIFDL